MLATLEEEAANQALIRELCTGRRLLDEMQCFREHDAAREAASLKSAKSAGCLGKPVLVIPQREWFRLREEQGEGCWEDRGFIRDMQKLAPELAPFKA